MLLGAGLFVASLPQTAAWAALGGIGAVLLLLFLKKPSFMPIFGLLFLLGSGYYTFSFLPRTLPPELPGSYYNSRIWAVGQVENITHQQTRTKLVLNHTKTYAFLQEPIYLQRINVITNANRLQTTKPGDWLALHVKFLPPTTAAEGFDSKKYLQQQHLSATAVLWGSDHLLNPQRPNSLRLMLENLRQTLANRYHNNGETGTLAAGLLVGKRGEIPETIKENFRASGLAHILSISGLHIGLVALLGFWGTRFLLVRLPNAPHLPIKTLSSFNGLSLALSYAALAGFALPTLRAASMLAIAYLAWMTGRYNQGLRGLAFIAGILVLLWPLNLVSPSFQMSFSATLALLLWGKYHENTLPPVRWLKIIHTVRTTATISLIATLATMPFVLWHFGQVSLNGVFANVFAIPVLAFWVLPLGLVDLILAATPAHFALWPALEAGLNTLLYIAHFFAGGAFGTLILPQSWLWLVSTLCTGTLTCWFLKRWVWRLFCLGGLLALFAFYAILPLPTYLWWDAESRTAALTHASSAHLLQTDKEKILQKLVTLWKQEDKRFYKPLQPATKFSPTCDAIGCVYTLKKQKILILEPEAIPTTEDCRQADVIISQKERITAKKCPVFAGDRLQITWKKGQGWRRMNTL